MIFLKTTYPDGMKLTVVYDPLWDGPIESWEAHPDWEVIYQHNGWKIIHKNGII
jgi:uncharacterized phage-associated protein